MPDLQTSLQTYDLGFLRIIAENWGIELQAPDASTALKRLAPLLQEPDLFTEIVETLPEDARQGLAALVTDQGRMPWTLFARQFGDIREMGPGRRDRERPDRQPVSPAERLYYHALIARNTFMTPDGAQLLVYIPDEFLAMLPEPPQPPGKVLFGRPATPAEAAHPVLARDWVVDDICTLLAWLRTGLAETDQRQQPDEQPFEWSIRVHNRNVLLALAQSAELIDAAHSVNLEIVKTFLEAGRSEALLLLTQSWRNSPELDELSLLPGLRKEGEWQTQPLRTRDRIFALLAEVPPGRWWSLPAFIAAVKENFPDFQRPQSDFDSWYIRDLRTGEFLRGFQHWAAVDGALLHFYLTGMLHWLGYLDLAAPAEEAPIQAFRLSKWWEDLTSGNPPGGRAIEDEHILLSSDARLRAPRLVPRPARYQIARFAEWEDAAVDAYRYRITPASLERARRQGLAVGQLIALLRRFALTVPPSLVQALERWENRGIEAQLEKVIILRLSTPELLAQLRQSRAARFLGDPIGPTAIIVRENAGEKVLAVLAELGYLGEANLETSSDH
jgi:hypothetical protein